VTGLPTDGNLYLAGGLTRVYSGEILTAAQLTSLLFKPTFGLFGTSSSFTYAVSDPSGTRASGTAALTIAPDNLSPVTIPASLTVAENSGASHRDCCTDRSQFLSSAVERDRNGLTDGWIGLSRRWRHRCHRG
jgi:hypothetical protein